MLPEMRQPHHRRLVLFNMKRIRLRCWPILLLTPVALICQARAQPSADVLADPPRQSFLILPLHVHVVGCAERNDLDCKLADEDVRRIVGKINGIWHKAGIHFALEPILHEKAAKVKEFALETSGKDKFADRDILGAYRLLAPPESRDLPGLHVYYIHQFEVNGVFLGKGMCVIKETARLRPVKGGIDEPLPRVTAHELGHAMGLPHRQDVTNLMASGTTGTTINAAEVEIVRGKARKISGVMTVDELEAKAKEAEATKETDLASSIRHELDQLPK
jgi:hypothetical protein